MTTLPQPTVKDALRALAEDLRRKNAALLDLVHRALETNLQQARRIQALTEAANDGA